MLGIHEDQVKNASSWFCSNYAQVIDIGPNVNVTEIYAHNGPGEDVENIQILSVPDCQGDE